jgi:hypothetical protein
MNDLLTASIRGCAVSRLGVCTDRRAGAHCFESGRASQGKPLFEVGIELMQPLADVYRVRLGGDQAMVLCEQRPLCRPRPRRLQ